MTVRLDRAWLRAHPLPPLDTVEDKNTRGRVLVIGGAEFVPGALRLTGEAALRAGAGKLQMATVQAAAMSLAVLVPEAAMIALPADDSGEIAVEAASLLLDHLASCDAFVLGPGMSAGARTEELVEELLRAASGQTIVLDAAALTCAGNLRALIADQQGRVIMTPHFGEMSQLTGCDIGSIHADPATAAMHLAQDFGAVVILKGVTTLIASSEKQLLLFDGGSKGLATSGSGDVLAGIVGGIAARGADALTAAAWGVYLHGAAGKKLSCDIAEVGFLARELSLTIPALIADLQERET